MEEGRIIETQGDMRPARGGNVLYTAIAMHHCTSIVWNGGDSGGEQKNARRISLTFGCCILREIPRILHRFYSQRAVCIFGKNPRGVFSSQPKSDTVKITKKGEISTKELFWRD